MAIEEPICEEGNNEQKGLVSDAVEDEKQEGKEPENQFDSAGQSAVQPTGQETNGGDIV